MNDQSFYLESKLDTDFDLMLVEIKPHLMGLTDKSEQERCARWIKQFCEIPHGIEERHYRNERCRNLLKSLRNGNINNPFDLSYGKNVFQDPSIQFTNHGSEINYLDSLATNLESSHSQNIGLYNGAFTEFTLPKTNKPDYDFYSFLQSSPKSKKKFNADDILTDRILTDRKPKHSEKENIYSISSEDEPYKSNIPLIELHEREMNMKQKLFEAELQERALKMQQNHDTEVEKILDRKNSEIEQLKTHYREKCQELQELLKRHLLSIDRLKEEKDKQERSKNDQIENQKMSFERENLKQIDQFETKMNEYSIAFEEERLNIQKNHSQNIQELLEKTNQKSCEIEERYKGLLDEQIGASKKMQSCIDHLHKELESCNKIINQLKSEKMDCEVNVTNSNEVINNLQMELTDVHLTNQTMSSDHMTEINSLKSMHEENFQILKHEYSNNDSKKKNVIMVMENKILNLEKEMDDFKVKSSKQIADLQEMNLSDKEHLNKMYEHKILIKNEELEQINISNKKQVEALKLEIEEREYEMKQLKNQFSMETSQTGRDMKEIRRQMENDSVQKASELKLQMDKALADLNRSKHLREKQTTEFASFIKKEKSEHASIISELEETFKKDKMSLFQMNESKINDILIEKNEEIDRLKKRFNNEIDDSKSNFDQRQKDDMKLIRELEEEISSLREKLIQTNNARKQQLIELGLLREKERQQALLESGNQLQELQCKMEKQLQELASNHNNEIDRLTEELNCKLKEKDHSLNMRIKEFELNIHGLNEIIEVQKHEHQKEIEKLTSEFRNASSRASDELQKTINVHNKKIVSIEQKMWDQKTKVRHLDKKLNSQMHDYEDKLVGLSCEYEKKMKGLLPLSVKADYDSIVMSLRSQIQSMKTRCASLEKELELHDSCTYHS